MSAAAVQPTLPGLEEQVTWQDRVRRADPAWLILAGLMAVFVLAYAPYVYRRQENFASFSWDMGIFDQAVWLLSRFRSFITVRGLNFWGHHSSPAMLVFVPFYWLGQGAHLLNLTQVTSMALGAVPVFLLARDRLADKWAAVGMAAVYLLHPALGFMGWELFHPEVIAITPLLFAYWFSTRQRWGWYAGTLIFAVAWKEDVALVAAVLGLIVLFRGHRKVGLITVAASVLYYLGVTRLMLPAVSGGVFYDQLYIGIGGSPGNIVRGAVRDPGNIVTRLSNGEARHYLWQLFAPFALLPLLVPEVLVLAVPMLLANLLSDYIWTRTIEVHYAALPIAALTIASVEAAAMAKQLVVRRVVVGVAVVSALLAAVAWGISPIGERGGGYWAYEKERLDLKRQAVAMVPDQAPVSASYLLVPQLAHRRQIYEYPNPFFGKNWGIKDRNQHDPAAIEWIVVDTRTVSQEDMVHLERLLDSGEFRLRFDKEDIQVAQRARPGGRNGEGRR